MAPSAKSSITASIMIFRSSMRVSSLRLLGRKVPALDFLLSLVPASDPLSAYRVVVGRGFDLLADGRFVDGPVGLAVVRLLRPHAVADAELLPFDAGVLLARLLLGVGDLVRQGGAR